MGETSRAKVPDSGVADLETPTCGEDVQLRQKNKSSEKQRSEKCTSAEKDPEVITPNIVLFVDTVGTELQKSDAEEITSEAPAEEVSQNLILLVKYYY